MSTAVGEGWLKEERGWRENETEGEREREGEEEKQGRQAGPVGILLENKQTPETGKNL